MGVLLGLAFGLGLLLIWSAFTWPAMPREPRGPGRLRGLLDRAGLAGVAVRSLVLLDRRDGPCRGPRHPGGLPYDAGRRRLRRARGVPPARRREGSRPSPPARVRRGVARGGRQPGQRGPRRGVAAGGVARLGNRGPEPLRQAFRWFAVDYQASGRFGDALDRLKATLADPVGDRVVEGLRIAREVGGGDLGRLLR